MGRRPSLFDAVIRYATKPVPTGTHPNPFRFSDLIGFGYAFEFYPISKHGQETGNGNIGTYSESISKLVPNVENYFITHLI